MIMGVPLSATVKAGRLIRLQGWFYLFFTVGLVIGIPQIMHKRIPNKGSDILLFVAVFLFSVVFLVVGSGVKKYQKWAKISGAVLALFSLLIVPIGTILGIITLFYLVTGWNESIPPTI